MDGPQADARRVYDVMRAVGIVAIPLNDAEDDEAGISEDLRPDDEVRH